MSKKCLVTTSLIGSVEWAQTAPSSVIKPEKGGNGKETWASLAIKDLKATLSRDSFVMNEAAQRGITFENKVYSVARSSTVAGGSAEFQDIVGRVIGGQFQRKKGMDYRAGGEDCYLYAKEDVYFPDKIIDIKTTAKYKADKYIGSIQHPIYCLVENVWRFDYLVAEWAEYPRIKKLHIIELNVDEIFARKIIDSRISQTFNFLKEHNLWEVYRDKYCLY